MNCESLPANPSAAPDDSGAGSPTAPSAAAVPAGEKTRPRKTGWQRFGGKFLVLSVGAHLVFLAIAAYLIVQKFQAGQKLTFQSGSKGPSAPTRALEHKVQMKKQNALSAPPQARRVTTTGLTKIALPDMPAMPMMTTALSPGLISGMGAGGLAPGSFGGAGGMGGNGGGAINFFGARTGGVGLPGTIYDLKQDRSRKPTGMDPARYFTIVSQFVKGGFNEAMFSGFFRGDQPLYASQLFVPRISADEGPKAFGMENIIQPRLWCVLYKGRVIAPESGVFRMVGAGDDVLIVRFDGRLILDNGTGSFSTWKEGRKYLYDYPNDPWYQTRGHALSDKFEVSAGSSHSIEILIGEQPGGSCQYTLLIEKEGGEYKKDARGNPILPMFRMGSTAFSLPSDAEAPPFAPDGPIWKVDASSSRSVFDLVR